MCHHLTYLSQRPNSNVKSNERLPSANDYVSRLYICTGSRQAILDQLERHYKADPNAFKSGLLHYFLVERREDLQLLDWKKDTKNWVVERAAWILDHGVNVDSRRRAETVMERWLDILRQRDPQAVIREGPKDILKFLLESGADLNLENPRTFETPLEMMQNNLSLNELLPLVEPFINGNKRRKINHGNENDPVLQDMSNVSRQAWPCE